MFIVYHGKELANLFLDEARAKKFSEEHIGRVFVLSLDRLNVLDPVSAWISITERSGQALFLERERALQYCVDKHGLLHPLFLSSEIQ